MTTQHLEQSDLDALAHRAHRRWIITMISIVVVGAVSGAVGGILGSHHHPHNSGHHRSSAVGVVVAVVVLVIWIGLLAWFLVHARRHKHGFFAPQLISGLKYRERRQVLRDVRRGVPSSDPLLRHVETSMAQRTVQYHKLTTIIFVLALFGEAFNAIIRHGLAGHLLYGAAAVAFAALGVYQRVVLAGARRYLASVAQSSAS